MEEFILILVFEEFERNKGKPLGINQNVCCSIGMLQCICGIDEFLQIGSKGVGRVYRICKVGGIVFYQRVID